MFELKVAGCLGGGWDIYGVEQRLQKRVAVSGTDTGSMAAGAGLVHILGARGCMRWLGPFKLRVSRHCASVCEHFSRL